MTGVDRSQLDSTRKPSAPNVNQAEDCENERGHTVHGPVLASRGDRIAWSPSRVYSIRGSRCLRRSTGRNRSPFSRTRSMTWAGDDATGAATQKVVHRTCDVMPTVVGCAAHNDPCAELSPIDDHERAAVKRDLIAFRYTHGGQHARRPNHTPHRPSRLDRRRNRDHDRRHGRSRLASKRRWVSMTSPSSRLISETDPNVRDTACHS